MGSPRLLGSLDAPAGPAAGLLLAAATLLSACSAPSGGGGILEGITRWEEGRGMSSSSARLGKDGRPDPEANVDCNRVVEPGATLVIADLRGPGVITHIWMTLYHFQSIQFGPEDRGRANPQEILLRMYWDGRENPDVEAPLGDFFAAGFGKRITVESIPVITEDGDSYNCWWRMPFRVSARIEVINQSAKPIRALFHSVDWIKKESLPANTLYFCAQYRQEYPVLGNPGSFDHEYLILDAEGKGHYVGTVMSVRTRSPDWFGEGDIRMKIDGEQRPSIWGTGTEDYFLSAWGQKRCSTLYFGTPYLSHMARDLGQMSSCYRWHLHDPIPFSKSLRVTIESMGWLNMDENPENRRRQYGQRQDDVTSVAFWYQAGPTKRFAMPTSAKERKLPCIDPVIAWGEQHPGQERRGKGDIRMLGTACYYDTDRLLAFKPESESEGWIEFSLQVGEKEPLRLILILGCSPESGIYQASLDGVAIGRPIDLYRAEREIDDFQLMDFWPEPGQYTLRLQCVGRNHLSAGHELRVNSVRLRERRPRVAEIGYLKGHDWRSRPILIDNRSEPLK